MIKVPLSRFILKTPKADLCFVYHCITTFYKNFHLNITRYHKLATLKTSGYKSTLLKFKKLSGPLMSLP